MASAKISNVQRPGVAKSAVPTPISVAMLIAASNAGNQRMAPNCTG
jgi:hypothetical protein